MKKRGQFYLLAAVVIIALIFGFVAIANYSNTNSSDKVEKLGKELEIEVGKVLEHFAYDPTTNVEAFTKNFSDYAGENINIIFIVGNSSNLDVYTYNGNTKQEVYYFENGDTITVEADGTNQSFDLKKGQNIYFVMTQEEGGAKYVYKN